MKVTYLLPAVLVFRTFIYALCGEELATLLSLARDALAPFCLPHINDRSVAAILFRKDRIDRLPSDADVCTSKRMFPKIPFILAIKPRRHCKIFLYDRAAHLFQCLEEGSRPKWVLHTFGWSFAELRSWSAVSMSSCGALNVCTASGLTP